MSRISEAELREVLELAFRRVDADQSGFLEKHELEDVLNRLTRSMGVEGPTDQDVDFIMRELDKNGDGKLSKDEFSTLVDEVLGILYKPAAENSG